MSATWRRWRRWEQRGAVGLGVLLALLIGSGGGGCTSAKGGGSVGDSSADGYDYDDGDDEYSREELVVGYEANESCFLVEAHWSSSLYTPTEDMTLGFAQTGGCEGDDCWTGEDCLDGDDVDGVGHVSYCHTSNREYFGWELRLGSDPKTLSNDESALPASVDETTLTYMIYRPSHGGASPDATDPICWVWGDDVSYYQDRVPGGCHTPTDYGVSLWLNPNADHECTDISQVASSATPEPVRHAQTGRLGESSAKRGVAKAGAE